MADIEIMPLNERLSDEEIVELAGHMEELGAPRLPAVSDDSSHTVGEGLDDDVVAEFLDRLEVHDLACEIYLPVEFEGRIETANVRIGSAQALIDVLEEMRDELFIEEDEDEDEDEEDEADDEDEDRALLEGKLRHVWKLMYTGAQAAIDRHLPLHLQS